MDRPQFEVADVFRCYGADYRLQNGASMSNAQHRVMTAIEVCRTAVLGGHLEQCDQCGHQRNAFNSCANRHCPKCQSLARAQWLQDRQAELLTTEYFHVVFTVPEQIATISYQNKRELYGILFRAAAETLRTIAADPKHLGAEIGFFAVLHTWGSNLLHHPHLHCVVTGGGLSADGTEWVSCRAGFFLPVRVLSRLFRRLFLEYLIKAFDAGKVEFFSSLESLRDRSKFLDYLAPSRQAEWVVYAKRPFAGPEQVLDYVGRYTHRVAISNHRLLDIAEGKVTFRYKDYRHEAQQKTMILAAEEFIRRFLLHVLPGLPAHPLLRLPGQPIPGTEISTLPRTLGHANARTTSLGNRQGLSRALRRTHRLFVVAVPGLSPRPNAGDQDLAATSTQASVD